MNGHRTIDCQKLKNRFAWELEKSNAICYRCNKKGHKANYCDTTDCNYCGKYGHLQKDCRKLKERARKADIGLCYNCGEAGHKLYQCPYRTRERQQSESDEDNKDGYESGITCWSCGRRGHKRAQCPRENE
ncbi:Oidioi.mRNA.OKI2018_I69.chr2.g3969.t1.cds [Oikopleura dioica]|uniref:Oidioi.mRNA.OKI2018_I69.chr2.g3969.t1.cds n=1 Tax=Oikopleura dioica TaxID=34765 RepID=A0ABN7T044_OIKDI|nr:Oidioi.mRNA.OKI2018_I69.chr2.g3969.t1.cds [Oikopleura dioica]